MNVAAELDKENRKGKGKMTEMTQADDGKGDGDDDDDDDSEAGDEGNDMQLAWEMLELAKLCYGSDVSQHRQQLAGESLHKSYARHVEAKHGLTWPGTSGSRSLLLNPSGCTQQSHHGRWHEHLGSHVEQHATTLHKLHAAAQMNEALLPQNRS